MGVGTYVHIHPRDRGSVSRANAEKLDATEFRSSPKLMDLWRLTESLEENIYPSRSMVDFAIVVL